MSTRVLTAARFRELSRWVAALAVAVLATLFVVHSAAADTVIEVYSRPGCPHCAEARQFLAALKSERSDFSVLEHDVTRDPGALANRARTAPADERGKMYGAFSELALDATLSLA